MEEKSLRGIKFGFRKSSSPVAYCALHIKSGTRNEEAASAGMAHFVEHLIFKGTSHKTSSVINSRLEKLGGELNAYTTKEETVLQATCLKEDLPKAISLLIELAFCSTFPQKEIDMERGVVIEEIRSYKDSPSEQIYDDFEELLFAGTPLATPILGNIPSIKRISRREILGYYYRMFVPENLSFSVVADKDEEYVRKILAKAIEKYSPESFSLRCEGTSFKPCTGITPKESQRFDKVITKKNHQAHCIIGCRAYSFFEQERFALSLLVNILGGPAANSRFNVLLREKNGLVYSIDASYTQYCDSGAVMIYFGCDKSNVDKCKELIFKTIEKYRTSPVSERELKEAKKQYIGQLAISADNSESQLLSMGKSLMVFGRIKDTSELIKNIESITSAQILQVARDIFDPEKVSVLTYL